MGNIQPLDRIAIELGPFTIYWYGIIIGMGILLGWLLATRESKKLGLPQDTCFGFVALGNPHFNNKC